MGSVNHRVVLSTGAGFVLQFNTPFGIAGGFVVHIEDTNDGNVQLHIRSTDIPANAEPTDLGDIQGIFSVNQQAEAELFTEEEAVNYVERFLRGEEI